MLALLQISGTSFGRGRDRTASSGAEGRHATAAEYGGDRPAAAGSAVVASLGGGQCTPGDRPRLTGVRQVPAAERRYVRNSDNFGCFFSFPARCFVCLIVILNSPECS